MNEATFGSALQRFRRHVPRPAPALAALAFAATVGGAGLPASPALADGTETLGPPSIPIAAGTGVAVGGTGMVDQPGMISVDVPPGAAVQQVLLYWEGQTIGAVAGDDTVTVNGSSVTGTLIGGPTFFFPHAAGQIWSSAFRADITALGLVGPGLSVLTIDEMDFSFADNGAGVLVIYDDGSDLSEIQLRDGLDLAFDPAPPPNPFPPPRDTTVAQTFTFPAAPADRQATLDMFFSSVSGDISTGAFRPNAIEITINGVTTVLNNLLDSNDGEEWDTVMLDVTIPAGATMLTVQALSVDNLDVGGLEASLTWTAAALAIEPLPPGGGEGCTPGYWKQPHHFDSWVGLVPGDLYDEVFGIDSGFGAGFTLLDALRQGGGKDKALGRHAVAALLNASTGGVSYAYTTADVIALVQQAYASGDFNGVKNLLAAENEQGCPLN